MAYFWVGTYFLICTGLIALGSLTKNPGTVQLFILPIGFLAVLFHKLAHKGKLRGLGFRLCSWTSLGKAAALPVLTLSLILPGSGVARTVLYALNISLLGTILGYLFLESRSLILCALCHGIWNALEYALFG